MRLLIAAVGRMKVGPERDLLDRYLARARAVCRASGVQGIDVAEIEEGRGRSVGERRRDEAADLLGRVAPADTLIALDERGIPLTSSVFAGNISRATAAGTAVLTFAIGGPDGLDEAVRARASSLLSFGAATLPHQLVRVVLSEQIYRAFTILQGHPYHRS